MSKVLSFIKNEIVMCVSFLLALVSMIFVTPSGEYLQYIDFRTLSLLFCLMGVIAGFNNLGLFKILAGKLLSKVKTICGVVLILVLLCFFGSMIITNDVALITFVPFTIVTLKLAGQTKNLILTVTLETISANLGSMLTPIGNPQNLFLFSKYNMTIADFFFSIFPYALLSIILLIVSTIILIKRDKITNAKLTLNIICNSKLIIFYTLLFVFCLLVVFRIFDNYILMFVIIAFLLTVFDRKVLLRIDYSLLLTFVFLFIFIGNLGRISSVNNLLMSIVDKNEVLTGVVASQVFSNVPTAILLSGFTNNAKELLIGVNLGGLGTLIASMASLISFKFIQKEEISSAKYLLVFTVANILFLSVNMFLYFIIK